MIKARPYEFYTEEELFENLIGIVKSVKYNEGGFSKWQTMPIQKLEEFVEQAAEAVLRGYFKPQGSFKSVITMVNEFVESKKGSTP